MATKSTHHRDGITKLLDIANRVRSDLNESKTYDEKIRKQWVLQIKAIRKKEGLSSPIPQSITSLEKEFVVFKCIDAPWQIAYGTINDNGKVNWGALNNTLKINTDTIPMTVFQRQTSI